MHERKDSGGELCEMTNERYQKGRYHNDYSPRYQEPYDIYEKAKLHMKKRRKEEKMRKEDTEK